MPSIAEYGPRDLKSQTHEFWLVEIYYHFPCGLTHNLKLAIRILVNNVLDIVRTPYMSLRD